MTGPRLTVVFVQFDQIKYPNALPRLLGLLPRLDVEWRAVVVDNARAGDWHHEVTKQLAHIGGDNKAWEFSALDRGLDWANTVAWNGSSSTSSDLLMLANDSLLAYGDGFLSLFDHAVARQAFLRNACIGWVDSFMEPCRILDYEYDCWLRTSLLIAPASVIEDLRPLTWPFDKATLFSGNPHQPFRRSAPLSSNLQQLLLNWLTTDESDESDDESESESGHWHSQFELTAEALPFFESKVLAILREHLLSARLVRRERACYDLRSLSAMGDATKAGRRNKSDPKKWQWLGWLDQVRQQERRADASKDRVLAVALGSGRENNRSLARFLSREVLPLVLQRHPGARGVMLSSGPPVLDAQLVEHPNMSVADYRTSGVLERTTALLLPPDHEVPGIKVLDSAKSQRVPIVGSATNELPTDHEASEAWDFAEICCRLIEKQHSASPDSIEARTSEL